MPKNLSYSKFDGVAEENPLKTYKTPPDDNQAGLSRTVPMSQASQNPNSPSRSTARVRVFCFSVFLLFLPSLVTQLPFPYTLTLPHQKRRRRRDCIFASLNQFHHFCSTFTGYEYLRFFRSIQARSQTIH